MTYNNKNAKKTETKKTETKKAEAKKKITISKEKQLIIYKIITIILLLILIVILSKWGYGKYIEYRAAKMYDQMIQQVNNASVVNNEVKNTESQALETEKLETEIAETQVSEESMDIEMPQKNIDWKKMHEINQDIYAWISIPNANIDYPILQHQTDDGYYLSHNIDGTKGYPGCIYTEKSNYKDFKDFNTVIYGHNMKNGMMFRNLHDYEDESYFEKNRYVYIYTEKEKMVFEIYAAYTSDDSHILNTNDFSVESVRKNYLENTIAFAKSSGGNVNDEIEVSSDSIVITLSTCTQNPKQRYLVKAGCIMSKKVE